MTISGFTTSDVGLTVSAPSSHAEDVISADVNGTQVFHIEQDGHAFFNQLNSGSQDIVNFRQQGTTRFQVATTFMVFDATSSSFARFRSPLTSTTEFRMGDTTDTDKYWAFRRQQSGGGEDRDMIWYYFALDESPTFNEVLRY